ncbi:MAG: cysteine desulfurase [Nanoarchaeota archaeon]|nr:cysteine desulfurase [Nanoarchaeota archaeon]
MNEKIRENFPFLKRKINGKSIIFLDNAASTQKPRVVINALKDFYENHYANIHRGLYKLSQEASEMYEEAHDKVAKFINADGREEIVFTKNTTESINLVAKSLNLSKGDEVIVTEMEHHSNLVPWMMLKDKGVILKYLKVNENGEINIDNLNEMLTKKTKVISTVHISNFLGTINPVKEIGRIAKEKGITFIVDGAQSVPHMPIDVKKIGCDFLAFSSHKMCGPTGIGVLYGKKEKLEELSPFLGGGDMISEVDYNQYKVNKLPWKFEAGTANIADGYAFGVAIDFLSKIGMEKIWAHEQKLIKYALEELQKIEEVVIYGPKEWSKRGGLVSFNISGLDCHDVAAILDSKYNICVRSGHHCTMPMHKKIGINGSVRASLYLYNNLNEVEKFVNAVKEIAEMVN